MLKDNRTFTSLVYRIVGLGVRDGDYTVKTGVEGGMSHVKHG